MISQWYLNDPVLSSKAINHMVMIYWLIKCDYNCNNTCNFCVHMLIWYTNCLSPLTLWIWIPLRPGVLNTTLCD